MEFVNRQTFAVINSMLQSPADQGVSVQNTASFPCGHSSFTLSLFIWKMGIIVISTSLGGNDNKADRPCIFHCLMLTAHLNHCLLNKIPQ